jgi:hypothetical protein
MRRMAGAMVGLTALSGVLTGIIGNGVAQAWPSRVYVSPHGWSGARDVSCATAGYRSINAALRAVATGGTVVVCPGTYRTQAVVRRPVSLIGIRAYINARGQKPVLPKVPGGSGIVVLRAHNVRVSGFVVAHAGYDGILVARSTHVTVSWNVLRHNGDVGVDFNGTSWSRAAHNIARYNHGGGVLVADDVGSSQHDIVSWNVASYNPGGCGIIIAGHSHYGVWDNWIADNWLVGNGTLRKAAGAGVVLASPVPGGRVSGNTVTRNHIYRNGLAGVTLHAHVPGQHLSGNRIVGNWIGRNNVLGDPIGLSHPVTNVPDLRSTGILVGAASRVWVTIRRNHISRNYYGIFLEGRVHARLSGNHFRHVHVPVRVVA